MRPVIDRLFQAARQRRWLRERGAMFSGADLLVISHTKSGRTWLRVMISHLYHLRYGLCERDLIRFDNFHEINAAIPKVHFARDSHFPPECDDPGAIRPSADQKTVLLVRDPRDVAVSFHFHVTKRAGARELARKGIDAKARRLPLFEFLIDPQLGVPRVMRFYHRWHAELTSRPNSMTLRYEDLHADTAGHLRSLSAFIGDPASDAEISAAIAFASFDAMKRKEKAHFFNSDRLGATNPADPESAKVRSGQIGGYRALLEPQQVDHIDNMVDKGLGGLFGYGTRFVTGHLS